MLCGWLSPQGEFYACPPYGHIHLAEELVISLNILPNHPELPTDDCLLNMHWLKLFQDGLATAHTISPTKRQKIISDNQLNWIMKMEDKLSSKQEYCLSLFLEFEDL